MKGSGPLAAVVGAVALLVVVAVGVVAFAAGDNRTKTTTVTVRMSTAPAPATAQKVSPAVAAGAHDFVQFACAQCHGERGRGGVSPYVPALTAAGRTLTAVELRHIIDHGLGESSNPTRPYMPVWGQVVSTTQTNDLVAYLRAGLPPVAGATPATVPSGQGDAVAGAALY